MPLINSCIFCKFKDLAVNGTIKKYTVQQGYSITTGEFVEIVSEDIVIPYNSVISGIANSSGSSGSVVEVIIPIVGG